VTDRFDQTVTEEDVVEAMEIGEPYATSEIADEVDLPHRTAYGVLRRLAEQDGRVEKKKPNETTCIWIRRE